MNISIIHGPIGRYVLLIYLTLLDDFDIIPGYS
jgi:hypothetical protein